MAMVSSCLGMRGVGNYLLPTASISFGAGSNCVAFSDDESPEMADQIGAGVCWHLTIILASKFYEEINERRSSR